MLTQQSIEEFRALYKKLYGEEIDIKSAEEQGNRLINFVKILMNAENKVKKAENKYEK